MNRRDLLTVGVGGVAATMAGQLVARADKDKPKKAAAAPAAGIAARNAALVAAVRGCVAAGEVCLQHCIESLASGSTMMKDCVQTVNQMLPVCRAMSVLAIANSPYLKDLAAACGKVCAACKDECDKHSAHAAECKACGDACGATLAELKKLG